MNPVGTNCEQLTEEKMKQWELFTAVDAIVRCLILREDPKRGGVILYGRTNTGKTSLQRYLMQIFLTVEYKPNKGNFD